MERGDAETYNTSGHKPTEQYIPGSNNSATRDTHATGKGARTDHTETTLTSNTSKVLNETHTKTDGTTNDACEKRCGDTKNMPGIDAEMMQTYCTHQRAQTMHMR